MVWLSLMVLLVGLMLAALLGLEIRRKNMHIWLGSFVRGGWRETAVENRPIDVLFCFVDHYEPMWGRPDHEKECERVGAWAKRYPKLAAAHRDADGKAPQHSFFYPEEEYRVEHLDAIQQLCAEGLGEIEIHLHHDDDTAEGLSEKLQRFVRILHQDHQALPIDPVSKQPVFAFIHGNWCLDNARPDGRWCGVNNELKVLAENGCYADFTLPAAPDPSQTRMINSIYYATDDPEGPKSHDWGTPLEVNGQASGDLMLIQGPLGLNWSERKLGLLPRIENADIRGNQLPTPQRIDSWVSTGVHVQGRPEWVFVKVHTHGCADDNIEACLGEPATRMYQHLETHYNDGQRYRLHYVTAREMFNIAKAAEAGHEGNPNQYRDFVLPRPAGVPQ